jgi:hypothetical protein
MALHAARMQAIMIDVSVSRSVEDSPHAPFSDEELEFRATAVIEIAQARARGEGLDFTPEIP